MSNEIDVNQTPRFRSVFRSADNRRVEIVQSKQTKGIHNQFIQSDIYHIEKPNLIECNITNQLLQTGRIAHKKEAVVFVDGRECQ